MCVCVCQERDGGVFQDEKMEVASCSSQIMGQENMIRGEMVFTLMAESLVRLLSLLLQSNESMRNTSKLEVQFIQESCEQMRL